MEIFLKINKRVYPSIRDLRVAKADFWVFCLIRKSHEQKQHIAITFFLFICRTFGSELFLLMKYSPTKSNLHFDNIPFFQFYGMLEYSVFGKTIKKIIYSEKTNLPLCLTLHKQCQIQWKIVSNVLAFSQYMNFSPAYQMK